MDNDYIICYEINNVIQVEHISIEPDRLSDDDIFIAYVREIIPQGAILKNICHFKPGNSKAKEKLLYRLNNTLIHEIYGPRRYFDMWYVFQDDRLSVIRFIG